MPQAYEPEVETEPESEDRAQEDGSRPTLPDGRLECEFCGRKFNPTSYERHQPVCQKVFGGTRPQFLTSFTVSKAVPARAQRGSEAAKCRSPPSMCRRVASQPESEGSAPVDSLPQQAVTSPQRTEPEERAGNASPSHLEEKEQRVMQVMSEQMQELQNLRQQVEDVPDAQDSEEPPPAPPEEDARWCQKSRPIKPLPSDGIEEFLSAADKAAEDSSPPKEQVGKEHVGRFHPEERPLPQPKHEEASKGSVELQLIACEDCGRRFNPASLEKHRAVCRSVFGKTRSTFESHHQRLRGVPEKTPSEVKRRAWEATPQPVATTPTTASSGSSGPRPEKREAAIASCEAAIAQLRAGAIESNGRAKGAVAREPKDLQPCPHCGRSFRPNVVEKHVKVCQSVFPSHDTSFKRRTEGPVLRKGSKASGPSRQANSTPPRSRGSTCGGEPAREREPASPIMSLHSEVPAEPKSQACLDVWEQEVEEAIQAMSEPQEPQVAASPMQGFRALEERATLLERARLGVKMGQKPQQALAGSMSEAVLRQTSQKHQSSTPSLASGHTMAARVARVAQASTAPLKLYEAPQASQARGGREYLSRSQPSVPTLEAPLSSRSSRRLAEVSPQRRASCQSLGTGTVGTRSGLRLPVQSREPVPVVTAQLGRPAAKVIPKPGVAREDPAPARIVYGSSVVHSESSSGSMRLPPQHTPREWQAPAPPPSPITTSPRFTALVSNPAAIAPAAMSPPLFARSLDSPLSLGCSNSGSPNSAPMVPRLDLRKLGTKSA